MLIGQTLSHYRVTAALGAGGMGEVYRATDTNLHRDVAIKVLPPEVASDPERLGRFRREAHLLASLNHPHIAAIYGLEEADGKPFLALELVEGEDLKERLQKGPIPVDEALEIAEQIAEALEEAHAKGIVHRDLKPANVKLTPEGKVKVLDFGLAKAWSGEAGADGSSIDLSQSPTLARTGTLAGVILGTAAYMSPEQASGKGVDKRADIWSFGVVLFEMLTGRPLFSGETASEVMASVIKEEPAWDGLPPGCPPAVTRLLRRCLRKRPRERLQDVGDARLEIQEVRSGGAVEAGGSTADVEAVRQSERRGRARERWISAAALVVVGVASILAYRSLAPAPPPPAAARFLLETPEGQSFTSFPSVSPDGRRVVFQARSSDGPPRLWLRPLDSTTSHPLGGTDGGYLPFWSPDGKALAFFAEGEIRRVNLSDGAVQRLAALPMDSVWDGGTWGSSDTILFADGGMGAKLFRVPANGGDPTAITTLDATRGETGHSWPSFLPDGRSFIFGVRSAQPDDAGVFVASLDAPDERRRVLSTTARTVWAAGRLLFATNGSLMAQRFDLDRLQTTGEPTPIASSVEVNTFPPGTLAGLFSASPGELLAYREATPARPTRFTWLSREGETLGTVGEPGDYQQMALSPDGRHLVAEVVDAQGGIDLWSFDTARGVASRVTTDPAGERDPVWLPDGLELVYSLSGAGGRLLRQGLRAGAPVSPVVEGEGSYIPESVAPDGRTLLASSPHTGGTEFVIWAIPLDGDGAPEAVLRSEFVLDEFQVSPDGRWLAYISFESGRFEVYVEPFRRPGGRVRVSVEGGGQPRWREDGKELFFSAQDAVMAVSVEDAETRLEVGTPRKLIDAPPMRPGWDDYAVTPDGKRFLVKVPIGEEPEPRFHVVLNWPSLLE